MPLPKYYIFSKLIPFNHFDHLIFEKIYHISFSTFTNSVICKTNAYVHTVTKLILYVSSSFDRISLKLFTYSRKPQIHLNNSSLSFHYSSVPQSFLTGLNEPPSSYNRYKGIKSW